MDKIRNKIEDKVLLTLKKYKNDNSVYYRELKKSYAEYKRLDFTDKITNDLYLCHMMDLCDLIKKRSRANYTIASLIIFIILIIGVTFYTSINYYRLSNDMKEALKRQNKTISLNVNYKNIEEFKANTLASEQDYNDITPLIVTISANSEEIDTYRIHYDVYIIEDNESIPKEELLDRDYLLYNVKSEKRDNGIKSMKDVSIIQDKLFIYSGEFLTNEEEDIDIRMWIDNNSGINTLNKKYKFKIYVDGYIM